MSKLTVADSTASSEAEGSTVPWCRQCGTQHVEASACPWPLEATGPERLAWKRQYETADGKRSIGVLISPVESRFRARVVTYPRTLWAVPGSRVVMKFVADSVEEVRNRAVTFIETVTAKNGYRSVDPEKPANVAFVPDLREEEKTEPATRKLHRIDAKWGSERPDTVSNTGNLSKSGMFLVTSTPLDAGTDVHVRLAIGAISMPLRGRVVWTRPRVDRGLPPGMGIQLLRPPAVYIDYVGRLP